MAVRVNMLWIGEQLGLVERACIRSVLRQGHPVTLWCYQPPIRVPAFVDLADAAEVLPQRLIIRHERGSVALFSNWFRYELQRLSRGLWLDTDIYLLKPIELRDYMFAAEPPPPLPQRHGARALLRRLRRPAKPIINGSVLHLPPDSPMLPPLLELFRKKKVPPWLPLPSQLSAYITLACTGEADLGKMPWGVAGPKALTALAARHGFAHLAAAPPVFQPFGWGEADWIADPRRRLEERTGDETVGIHLWNECIKLFKDDPAPPGSFLARLQAEGAQYD